MRAPRPENGPPWLIRVVRPSSPTWMRPGAGWRAVAGTRGGVVNLLTLRRAIPDLPRVVADIVRNVTDLPWDFVVLGIPKSVQARASSIQRWKAQVRAAAWEFWPPGGAPLDHKVQIHVTYYHDSAPLDVDNMLKPIQDALSGLVYVDDNQLVDTHGHLRDLNGQYRVRGLTPAQARGFTSGSPFVHVRIEMPSPAGELP